MPTAQTTAALETVAGSAGPLLTARAPYDGGIPDRVQTGVTYYGKRLPTLATWGARVRLRSRGCGEEGRDVDTAAGGDVAGRGPGGGGRRLHGLPGPVGTGARQRDDP